MNKRTCFSGLFTLTLLMISASVGAQPERVVITDKGEPSFNNGEKPSTTAPSAENEVIDLGLTRDRMHELVGNLGTTNDTPLRLNLKKEEQKPQVAPETLIYDEDEVRQRAKAIKSGISSILGAAPPDEASEEERELKLQREIELDKSYANAGSGTIAGNSANASNPQRDSENQALKLRLIELSLIAWDVATHPVTIFLLILAFLARLALAIVRLNREKHGHRRRHSRSAHRSSEDAAAPMSTQPLTEYEQREERRRKKRYSRSRRHHRRSSILDLFRST